MPRDPSLKTCKLVPFSGTQFYTARCNPDEIGNFSRLFYIVQTSERPDPNVPLEEIRLTIKAGWNDDGSDDPVPPPPNVAEEISVSKVKAFEAFLGQWMPIPVLRVLPGDSLGRRNLAAGPTNWARVLVTRRREATPGEGSPELDVVYLFDTELDPLRGEDDVDLAPTEVDAFEEVAFRFAPHVVDASRFLRHERDFVHDGTVRRHDVQQWASLWVERVFEDAELRRKGGRQPEEEERRRWPLEARCRYLAFLQFLAQAAPPPEIRFADTLSADAGFRERHKVLADKARQPVDVSLVLDVGNSRTCGVLIESFPTSLQRADLKDAMVLRLRDLSRPHRTDRKPFESHVELSQPYFGFRHLSEMSGRGRAFFWPSLVRVGPEATRFRDQSEGIEALSGLSSPKRYLYDVSALNQQWSFQPEDARRFGGPPPLDDHVRSFVGPRGDVRRQVDEEADFYRRRLVPRHDKTDIRGYPQRLSFSRSSMFTFMLAEIIWQAFTMVNSPQVRATRAEADTQRRLTRIVLTIPTAMPITEQSILRSRASAAIKLIWDLLGWTEKPPTGVTMPVIDVSLDEASCIQFVYLYGEIAQHFRGATNAYFDLMGQPRCRPAEGKEAATTKPERSLRIASVDVGGGTTDLMVTTYYLEGAKALVPFQNFREGFRVAGDDLLRDVVQRCIIHRGILPAAEKALTDAGANPAGARRALMERFSSERADMREQDRHRRRQFVTRILRPAAIALLLSSETSDWASEESTTTRTLRDLVVAGGGHVDDSVMVETAAFIDEVMREKGAESFSVLDLAVEIRLSDVRLAVDSTFRDIFGNIAEMVNHLDCDIVLFAGRPSRLPATVELFTNKLAVSPDRVVPLGTYPTGPWYPFGALDNFIIEDPKTATVTGAMLALFAQRDIENFTIFANRLKHKSCAVQIGELSANGQLRAEDVVFTFDPARPPGEEERGTLKYFSPVRLGYRQLPLDRWVATPLYLLRLVGSGTARDITMPVAIELERESPDEVADFNSRLFPANEARKEALKLSDATTQDGAPVLPMFALELNTMPDAGYWLDTGILTIN